MINIKHLLVILIIFLAGLMFAIAEPEAPTNILNFSSTAHQNATPYQMTGGGAAEAGNVSYINITAVGPTKTWAAYYGNVTGTLVLENSNSQAVYQWAVSSPGGKVIATENVVTDWTNLYCWNWTPSVAGNGLTSSEFDAHWNISGPDIDNITNTFDPGYRYDNFTIVHKKFDAADVNGNDGEDNFLCPAIQLNNETGVAPVTNSNHQYEEIILARTAQLVGGDDFTADDLIYVALIERTAAGFTGEQIDFEIIVPNDQHADASSATPYYFYVELEAS